MKWALDGHGILMRAEWDIRSYLEQGRLVQVLPGWQTPNADIFAVYSQRQQLSTRVRSFVDFIARELAEPSPKQRITVLGTRGTKHSQKK